MNRVLFLGEGSSDQGIKVHVQRIADSCGIGVEITAPDAEMLPIRDKTVFGKLRAVQKMGGRYDVVLIHRDADRDGRERRLAEIREAVYRVMPKVLHAAIIPIRMTEAWLILDEQLIRDVAGNPNGRVPLDLPSVRQAEKIADPKALLKDLLVTASELTGRKRSSFQSRFSHHRRQVLERLDPHGPVRHLKSWCDFHDDVRQVFEALMA
ncbi:MAG TPA: hypothetical protein VF054_15610 [Micromonosporaceae bacterium]